MPRVTRRDCEDPDSRFPLLMEVEAARPGASAVYTAAIGRPLDGAPPSLTEGSTLFELFE